MASCQSWDSTLRGNLLVQRISLDDCKNVQVMSPIPNVACTNPNFDCFAAWDSKGNSGNGAQQIYFCGEGMSCDRQKQQQLALNHWQSLSAVPGVTRKNACFYQTGPSFVGVKIVST